MCLWLPILFRSTSNTKLSHRHLLIFKTLRNFFSLLIFIFVPVSKKKLWNIHLPLPWYLIFLFNNKVFESFERTIRYEKRIPEFLYVMVHVLGVKTISESITISVYILVCFFFILFHVCSFRIGIGSDNLLSFNIFSFHLSC